MPTRIARLRGAPACAPGTIMTWRAYGLALASLVLLDGLWLGVLAKDFYLREMGNLMTDQVRWVPAALFYLLYPLGVLYFCAAPSRSRVSRAAMRGAALGLLVYGVYDLTNMATLRQWSMALAVTDVLWGSTVTSATAAAAAWVMHTRR